MKPDDDRFPEDEQASEYDEQYERDVNENDQIGEQAVGHYVSSNESRFRADGLELFYRSWKPALRSRARIVIAHGIGEHSGRYERDVQAFLARGFAVEARDHRWH